MRNFGKESLTGFVTARELATALGLNEQSVYRFARAGIIPSIRIGRKILRFDAEQVCKALAGRKQIYDLLLVHTALDNDIETLYTFNDRPIKRFKLPLKIINPARS